ncbi:hypothetical protein VM1G_05680 [Cytospora mali]|uniref:Carcinoembryonic antigen-related cell adhesion molecule 1 n=1 Tax=Cytospora mali TaxID=578113 RepID=A0A194W2B7_CYTMA|nr:hypothetical protein VM1G_05680 [Valsa mali]
MKGLRIRQDDLYSKLGCHQREQPARRKLIEVVQIAHRLFPWKSSLPFRTLPSFGPIVVDGRHLKMLQLCHLTAAASVLLAGIWGTLADDSVQFLYPVDTGLIFHYLDRIDVSYQSNYSAPYLFTWCDPDDVQGAQSDRPDAYNATTEITLQFTSDGDLDCWFNLRETDSTDDQGINSVQWTFVNTTREGGPATLGLPTTAATTSTPVSTPTANTIATTTVTASAAPSTSGLSTGAKAGLGIGIAVGVVAIAAIAGALLFRRRKRTRSQGKKDAGDMGGRASPSPFQGMAELEEQQGPAELEIVSHSSAALKGKYAPVAAYSPQEMPADYPGSKIEPQELPAAVDREHREGQ